MSKLKINGKELRTLGFPEGPVISVAMKVMEKHYKHHTKEEAFEILAERWLETPANKYFKNHFKKTLAVAGVFY